MCEPTRYIREVSIFSVCSAHKALATCTSLLHMTHGDFLIFSAKQIQVLFLRTFMIR
jgi:hypothetical protein